MSASPIDRAFRQLDVAVGLKRQQQPALPGASALATDLDRDWEWEGVRVGNKLHLFCYLQDRVLALEPVELEA